TRFSRDWSSDVCSSDLLALPAHQPGQAPIYQRFDTSQLQKDIFLTQRQCDIAMTCAKYLNWLTKSLGKIRQTDLTHATNGKPERSEERRVGKEGEEERT